MPPAMTLSLYKDDARYKEVYFKEYPGYYDTMDVGFVDAKGNIAVMSRADDVINVAGHRLSTSAIEEVSNINV